MSLIGSLVWFLRARFYVLLIKGLSISISRPVKYPYYQRLVKHGLMLELHYSASGLHPGVQCSTHKARINASCFLRKFHTYVYCRDHVEYTQVSALFLGSLVRLLLPEGLKRNTD